MSHPPINLAQPSAVMALARRYGIGFIATLLALVLTRVIAPVAMRSPFLLFLGAVMFSAWYSGTGAGILAILLTVLAQLFFVYPDPFQALVSPEYLIPLTVFTLVSLFVVVLTASRQRQAEAAQQANTKVVQLAATLAHRVAELQTLQESAPVGIAIGHDPKGEVITANRVLSEWLGTAAETNVSLSQPPADSPGLYQVYAQGQPVPAEELPIQYAAQHAASVREQELEIVRADGRVLELLCYAEPLFDDHGHVRGAVATFIDITARQRAEAERLHLYEAEQAARAQAEAALRIREQFIAIASHELKTPLTSLKGYAELLSQRASKSGLDESFQRMLRVINVQTVRLEKLIAALLDISRIEQGHLELERAPVDLCELVRSLVDELQPTLLHHRLEVAIPEGPLSVEGDALRLQQVMGNLVQNAIKYTPRGGTVCLGLSCENGGVCLRVADSGIGIPAEDLPQLFQRFHRARNAEAHHISGLGIGLYVSREIVNLHGGTIEVASEEGKGSTFMVRLPLAAAGATAAE